MTTENQIEVAMLDDVITKMVAAVSESKCQIVQMGEISRQQFEQYANELTELKQEVKKLIKEKEQINEYATHIRKRLSDISREFHRYSESEIKDAYDKVFAVQNDLTRIERKEGHLAIKAEQIEDELCRLKKIIDKADLLVGQVSIVLNYLSSDFHKVNEMLEQMKKKQDYGLQIIEAQEEERRRLSREIHDGPAQLLANVMIRSQLIERVFKEKGTEEGFKEVNDLRLMVKTALYEVRRIIYDLRPMTLDDLGLIPTLKKYLATIEEYNSETNIHFVNIGLERRLPSRYEVALFRLIQEAVQNALKHSRASIIKVELKLEVMNIAVTISDNGKGFETSTIKESSFGLVGMKERVELLEGKLSIESSLGKGTIIIITLPLEEIEKIK